MPVREHDQVSARNFDLLFLAFDLEPALSLCNRVKASDWLPVHAKRPRRAEIRSTIEGAANVQVGKHVIECIQSRELVQKLQAAVLGAASTETVFASEVQPRGRI